MESSSVVSLWPAMEHECVSPHDNSHIQLQLQSFMFLDTRCTDTYCARRLVSSPSTTIPLLRKQWHRRLAKDFGIFRAEIAKLVATIP
eukprot:scaffold906_cov151-Amphora_coffeaeformis.AAC.6